MLHRSSSIAHVNHPVYEMWSLSLPAVTRHNPLLKKHLWGLKTMGFIIFEDQSCQKLHIFRGFFFSLTFSLFNVTQVSL